MAALNISASGSAGFRPMSPNTLTASDTFTYQPGDILIWKNGTGGSAALTFAGSAAAIIGIPGYGLANPNSRTTQAIDNNAWGCHFLDDIWQYLQGIVTVTGGAGSILYILRR